MTALAATRNSRWIPWLFVLGFTVTLAINATLIAFAAGSFSGLVVEHPYRKGAEYAHAQAMLQDQRQLNWYYRLRSESRADGSLDISIAWQDGAAALIDLQVTAEFIRPVENAPPMTVMLQHRGAGVYTASVSLPAMGLWDVRIMARRDEARFVAAERLVLR